MMSLKILKHSISDLNGNELIGAGGMWWKEIQEPFPEELVVLEAKKAHSEVGLRYIVIVIDSFADSKSALCR